MPLACVFRLGMDNAEVMASDDTFYVCGNTQSIVSYNFYLFVVILPASPFCSFAISYPPLRLTCGSVSSNSESLTSRYVTWRQQSKRTPARRNPDPLDARLPPQGTMVSGGLVRRWSTVYGMEWFVFSNSLFSDRHTYWCDELDSYLYGHHPKY